MCGEPMCQRITPENACDHFPDLGVTPGPEPSRSDKDHAIWQQGFQKWGQVQCPCGNGYFCRRHGKWIPGTSVTDRSALPRERQLEGRCPEDHYEKQPQEDERHKSGRDAGRSAEYRGGTVPSRKGEASKGKSRESRQSGSEKSSSAREKGGSSRKKSDSGPSAYQSNPTYSTTEGSVDSAYYSHYSQKGYGPEDTSDSEYKVESKNEDRLSTEFTGGSWVSSSPAGGNGPYYGDYNYAASTSSARTGNDWGDQNREGAQDLTEQMSQLTMDQKHYAQDRYSTEYSRTDHQQSPYATTSYYHSTPYATTEHQAEGNIYDPSTQYTDSAYNPGYGYEEDTTTTEARKSRSKGHSTKKDKKSASGRKR
ncbi:hypothetical protein QQS21_004367 [Conoideocrella luteorostrata]|uniref:Uncharacterized protein n=1 Tax=Conoideocrella luteorostrata TaxID=1105319 RepID=A0AAJ0FZU8_9HYPO|nr:hypothetical protein QQS21_004367 [Conoideocrella luteorostrata]